MSKGPVIKDWVKWHINVEATKNRAEPRDAVAERIEQFLEGKEPIPSRETLIKMISAARNSADLEDRPWTVSSLVDYEISPEALPVVMKAWARALELDKHLSIRQVKWIARLYNVLKDKDLESLIGNAFRYAEGEKVIRPEGKYPIKSEDAWWLWLRDAELYRLMSGDDNPYRKCREHVKSEWVLVDRATVTLKIDRKQKEDHNERSHNQER